MFLFNVGKTGILEEAAGAKHSTNAMVVVRFDVYNKSYLGCLNGGSGGHCKHILLISGSLSMTFECIGKM